MVATPTAPEAGLGEPGAAGGDGGAAVVTATLSNVDVFSWVVSWLVTISPISAVDDIVTLVVPTAVHVVPSGEAKLVTVDPVRTSFNHAGGAWVAPLR